MRSFLYKYLGGSWEAYDPGRTLVGASTTDTDFALDKQGGAKTVDVGRSTDLAAGVNFNDHAGVHVAVYIWRRTA